jgi:hypothetical protein
MSRKKPGTEACCGVFVSQRNRLAKISGLIQELSVDDSAASRGRLRRAIEEKEMVEQWLASHSHRQLN